MAQLDIKHKLPTAYYPQIDGQIKYINQILEQFLRYFYIY